MDTLRKEDQAFTTMYECGLCAMFYHKYKELVEHLYWRHGTQGYWCTKCSVKRWAFTMHKCNVLPTDDHDSDVETDVESDDDSQYFSERETVFCYCGKYLEDANMIGCDGPHCVLKWYHFSCVGIETAPDGDWLCPECNMDQSSGVAMTSNISSWNNRDISHRFGNQTSRDMSCCSLVGCDLPTCNLARWLSEAEHAEQCPD